MKFWTTGTMMSLARILLPSPSLYITDKGCFSLNGFFLFPQESCPKSRVDQTPRATCTHRAKTIPFACYKCYCACVAEELLQHLHLCLDPPKLNLLK